MNRCIKLIKERTCIETFYDHEETNDMFTRIEELIKTKLIDLKKLQMLKFEMLCDEH